MFHVLIDLRASLKVPVISFFFFDFHTHFFQHQSQWWTNYPNRFVSATRTFIYFRLLVFLRTVLYALLILLFFLLYIFFFFLVRSVWLFVPFVAWYRSISKATWYIYNFLDRGNVVLNSWSAAFFVSHQVLFCTISDYFLLLNYLCCTPIPITSRNFSSLVLVHLCYFIQLENLFWEKK